MIVKEIHPAMRVNLERICWSNGNQYYNQKVIERLYRSTFLKGKPKRVMSTNGSDTYHFKFNRVNYEVILGKKEKRGLCVCKDFERNLEIAKSKDYEFVMPCKHLIKVMCHRRTTRK